MVAHEMFAAQYAASRHAEPSQGDVVADRFRLIREIARGGMGIVYEARHLFTQRTVALKFVPAGMSDQRLANQRLEQEARALGACRHRHIVDIVDAGVSSPGGMYLAMEMLEGRTLDGILAARKSLAGEEVLRVASAIGSALAHAHAKGVVHRDVKPSNIFIARRPDGKDEVKLIDFGIAGGVTPDAVAPPSGRITRGGDMLGTLDYVAPEQLSAPDLVTPLSDQYALATTLLECLTGSLPSLTDRLAGKVRLPSASELARGINQRACEAILRAMSPAPSSRFESVEDFLHALFAGGAGQPTAPLLQPRPSARPSPGGAAGPAVDAGGVSRRKHKRAPYIAPCRVVRADGSTIDGRSEDISEGGILIVLPATYRGVGTAAVEKIHCRFALPTTGVVATVVGTVRWLKDGQGRAALGVSFDEPSEVVRKSIAAYVSVIGTDPS